MCTSRFFIIFDFFSFLFIFYDKYDHNTNNSSKNDSEIDVVDDMKRQRWQDKQRFEHFLGWFIYCCGSGGGGVATVPLIITFCNCCW